jgi:energy-coupling factor transporter ATP-binding protein EcfA2
MIAYLGINRLFPFGEFKDDESLSQVKRELPDKYKETIRELYKEFTGYDISGLAAQKMGLIKNRYEFHSKTKGVDSNTISAGEDNLLILITTIICLSYFRDSLKPEFSQTPIIMLIDEFDATLHPEFQIKLVNTLYKLSKSHNIQVIFTTHSISLLDYMLDMKMNVIYMKDDVQRISVVEDIDKYKLEQYLKNELASSIYIDRNIPVFSEDNETREFIEILFNSTHDDSFSKAKSHLHLVEASIGADVLRQIFKNDPVSKTSIHSICILDGDQNPDIRDCIISLPGGKNPEEICFEYATELFNNTDENATIFWNEVENRTTITKHYFDMNIRPNITYESRKSAVTDNHKLREVNKELFNKSNSKQSCG